MTQREAIDDGDVRRVAELANLELSEREEAAMVRELNSILAYVAQLNELDTSSVPAMAQVSEILNDQRVAPVWRADEPAPSLDRSTVMAAAPDSDGVYFRVPKVIER